MFLRKIVSPGLAHNSYFIGSRNKAAVIDPRRDIDAYLDLARERDMRISHVFETHKNEDYIIGSLELLEKTGARILHGDKLDFGYGEPAREGDSFQIGDLELGILETPGHTYESISITLKDGSVSDDILMVFTGDALFAGDVGRTDFYGKDNRRKVSGLLYDSIHEKLLPLGDEVIVLPAHGAGSVCGGNISNTEFTTIGYERANNSMLQLSREEFAEKKYEEEPPFPPYFRKMEDYNREGPPVMVGGMPRFLPIDLKDLRAHMDEGAQILDVRTPASFAGASIPGSINIWKHALPEFAGWILNYEAPIVVIDEENNDLERVLRYLLRIGYDNLGGYLAGGFFNWYKSGLPLERMDIWSVQELEERLDEEDIFLLDVRSLEKWISGHIPGAQNIFVGHVEGNLDSIPKGEHIVVYCDSGFKTNIALSLLKKNGFENLTCVLGGIMAWKNAGYSLKEG